jgi:hypothetical protein
MNDMPTFRYGGARALTILHEKELRGFVDIWKKAKAAGVKLPAVKNPDYENFDRLLFHVVFRARENMIWVCNNLKLPDPQFESVPDDLDNQIDQYLDRLLLQFRLPLVDVRGREFYFRTYTSEWKTEYCIDAMMEHLVIHAMRHTLQLKELLQRTIS